jgi:WD40 repeat protein
MLRKFITLLSVLAFITAIIHAQEATSTPGENLGNAPTTILNALAALSTELGTAAPLRLSSLSGYSWAQEVFNDTSLGCPQEGQTYTQAVTRGYVFVFVYNNTTYDYRTSEDGTTVFLCESYPVQQAPERTSLEAGEVITPENAGSIAEIARLNTDQGVTGLAAWAGEVIAAASSAETGGIYVYPADTLDGEPDFYATGDLPVTAIAFGTVETGQTFLATGNLEGDISFFQVVPPGLDVMQMETTDDDGDSVQTVNALAVSPDLLIIAAGDSALRLYSTRTGGMLVGIESENPITAVAFGNAPADDNSVLMATGDSSGVIRLYAVTINASEAEGVTVQYEELDVLNGHTDMIRDLEFSPDGTLLASGSMDMSARLWNVTREDDAFGAEVANLSSGTDDAILSVAFSPSGDLLATAGGDSNAENADNAIRLWDISTPTDVSIAATLTGYDTPVGSLDFSPDGTLLMSAGENGTIRLWGIR